MNHEEKLNTKYYIIVGSSLKEILLDFCGQITSIPPMEKFVEKNILVVAYGDQTEPKELTLIFDIFESSLPIICVDIKSFKEKIKNLNKTIIEIDPASFKSYKNK